MRAANKHFGAFLWWLAYFEIPAKSRFSRITLHRFGMYSSQNVAPLSTHAQEEEHSVLDLSRPLWRDQHG